MGILDDALSSQDGKRSQRLSREARKSKIDSNKIKEGTYRGVNLVDGTANIQLDGQATTTSGYRLITNAPLGDGDRVSIRPNGVGLPRADARNVAPKVDEILTVKEFVFLDLVAIVIQTFTPVDFQANGSPLQQQRWTKKSNGKADKFDGWERPTFPQNVFVGSGVTPNLRYEYKAAKEWIELTADVGASVPTTNVTVGIQFSPNADFASLTADLIDEVISPTSKLEVEFISSFGTLDEIFFNANFFSFSASYSGGNASVTPYNFKFRYRRRGASRWFQL